MSVGFWSGPDCKLADWLLHTFAWARHCRAPQGNGREKVNNASALASNPHQAAHAQPNIHDFLTNRTKSLLHGACFCVAAGQQPELDAAGRLNGEFGVRCHDAASWKFPSFSGQMACNGIDFHFWDAVDDLSNVDMTLVFDDQRMYMHNASGMFGSIPLTLSGEHHKQPLNA